MLTHIFSPATCAQCRLCCHFCQRSAWETPFLESELAALLEQNGVPLMTRPNGSKSFALHFTSNDPEENCNCPLLDTAAGCTLPREKRPFECRVWPIRLMHDEQHQLCIAYYSHCPALQTPDTRQKLIHYATNELLPILLDYAERFPKSIRPLDYHYSIIRKIKNAAAPSVV